MVPPVQLKVLATLSVPTPSSVPPSRAKFWAVALPAKVVVLVTMRVKVEPVKTAPLLIV